MRLVGWLAALSMTAAPAIAGPDGEYDPCKNRGLRRVAIVFASKSPGKAGECKGNVYPDKKRVCGGDTVLWSVINACDVEQVAEIRLEGLERVADEVHHDPPAGSGRFQGDPVPAQAGARDREAGVRSLGPRGEEPGHRRSRARDPAPQLTSGLPALGNRLAIRCTALRTPGAPWPYVGIVGTTPARTGRRHEHDDGRGVPGGGP